MSDKEGAGGGKLRPCPLFAYTKAFNKVFPYYLAIGMTYEQFWEQDVELVKHYREAAKIKRDQDNLNAWIQGMYFYEALCDASPLFNANAKKGTKAKPYPKEPFDFYKDDKPEKKKEKEIKSDKKAKDFMEIFAYSFNKRFKEKQKTKGGE